MDDAMDLTPQVERLRKKIGEESPAFVHEIEKGALIKFSRAIGETNPIYFDEEFARTTRFGGIIAPPTYVSYFATHLTEQMFDFETPGVRSLHSDDVTENFVPIRPGDTITAIARYADVSSKPGRNGPMLFQSVDTILTNQKGERAAVVRMIVVSFK